MTDDITRTRPSVAVNRNALADELVAKAGESVPVAVGKYQVTGYLGRGGIGIVLAAEDTELRRPVALKLLHPGVWGEKASTRIGREAQAMAKLSHPNVVTVYEVGRSGVQPFIAMELVTGVTLREWLRGEQRSWRKTLAMVVAAGRGLAAAHAAGLVHRDFKPENILVGGDDRPRVTDFGLVASTTIVGDVDEPEGYYSMLGGTPAYMAPEQREGCDIDARADQFAFAVTCWESLWGKRPFSTREVSEPERIRARHGVPRRVETVLRRALHADRDQRWSSLSELLDRLERIARDRRAVFALAVMIPMVVVGAIAFHAGAGAQESPCRGDGTLGSLWSTTQQRSLSESFGARTEPFARETWADVQRSVGSWIAEYHDVRVQTCQARRSNAPGSAVVSVARDRCLDRRRDELAALLAAFEKPDSTTVQYARAAARGLTRPIACLSAKSDSEVVSPLPLSEREKLRDLHRRLAEASTQRALGKPRDAVAVAESVAKEADTLGWAPLIAESQLELGLSYQAANSNAEGERAHARAVLQADAAQDDEVRFAATIGLAVAGMNHSRYDDSGKAIETARMIARRLPPDSRRDVTLEMQASILEFWRGNYDACLERGRPTLSRISAVLGPQAIEGAILRANVAFCLHKLGRYQESEEMQREGLAIADVATGREHPIAAELMFMLGYNELELGRPDEALRLMREALAIRERVLGAENPIVGLTLTGVGELLMNMGRYEEARANLERARRAIIPLWGTDSPALSIAERLLGDVAMRLGEYKVAEAHFRRDLEIRIVKRPPGHDERSFAMGELGGALLAQGDRRALPYLKEAAEAMARSPGVVPGEAAAIRYRLGRALVEFEDRRRGLALIKGACPVLETEGDLAWEAKQCRDYLAKLTKLAP